MRYAGIAFVVLLCIPFIVIPGALLVGQLRQIAPSVAFAMRYARALHCTAPYGLAPAQATEDDCTDTKAQVVQRIQRSRDALSSYCVDLQIALQGTQRVCLVGETPAKRLVAWSQLQKGHAADVRVFAGRIIGVEIDDHLVMTGADPSFAVRNNRLGLIVISGFFLLLTTLIILIATKGRRSDGQPLWRRPAVANRQDDCDTAAP